MPAASATCSALLGFERGTVVGHSLGGGIAMQLAYQFPEYCERLVLVSSGGLGREVSPVLRAATLPGAELVMPLIARDWAVRAGGAVAGALEKVGLRPGPTCAEFGARLCLLVEGGCPMAFLHTLRAVIDPGGPAGQRAGPPLSRRGHADPDRLG